MQGTYSSCCCIQTRLYQTFGFKSELMNLRIILLITFYDIFPVSLNVARFKHKAQKAGIIIQQPISWVASSTHACLILFAYKL